MGITHCDVRLNLDVPTNIQFSVVAKTELGVVDSRCFPSTKIVSSACACVLSPTVNEYGAFPASSSTKIFCLPGTDCIQGNKVRTRKKVLLFKRLFFEPSFKKKARKFLVHISLLFFIL